MTLHIQDYQVFFFDLDGLLVDTEPLYYRAFLSVCRQYNVNITIDFLTYYRFAMLGRDAFQKEIVTRFPEMQTLFPQCFYEREKFYQRFLSTEVPRLLPGVKEFLDLLSKQKKTLGVVTNSSRISVERFYDMFPIFAHFQFFVTREDYERPKPYSDSYCYAYQNFVREGERVIGFEDSVKGLRALAGIPAALVGINSQCTFSIASHQDFYDKELYYFPSFCDLMAHVGEQNHW
ncbi:HAD family hydrolase [Chlamydia gallinacea]|uniref:HAD family hydrolase n=1 Tax=Chlamydia gallinacea TaxID=1457153 RepID=UPI00098E9A12|nr:HAD family phosphatase [Chlamydia gallinacea]AQT77558.1 HAD family hydrolase [Chlamydia gallinacea]